MILTLSYIFIIFYYYYRLNCVLLSLVFFSVVNITSNNNLIMACDSGDIPDVQFLVSGDRGILWRKEEVDLLINAWGDSSIQSMIRGAKSHKEVFQKISEQLPGRDWSSCQKKMQKLRREYMKFNDKLKKTGQTSELTPPSSIAAHYELLDEILHERPLTEPNVIQSGV